VFRPDLPDIMRQREVGHRPAIIDHSWETPITSGLPSPPRWAAKLNGWRLHGIYGKEPTRALSESPTTRSGTMRMLFPGRASAVREVGALSDLDNISVRIADVAARLAVFGDRLRDELGSSTFP
jgi:hypothetical protein